MFMESNLKLTAKLNFNEALILILKSAVNRTFAFRNPEFNLQFLISSY